MVLQIKDQRVLALPIEASLVHSSSYIVKDDRFQSKDHFRAVCNLLATTLAFMEANFYQNLHFRLNSYNFDQPFIKMLKGFDEMVKNLFVSIT